MTTEIHPKRSRLVLPPDEYKKLCNEVHERDNWKCRNCGVRRDLHCHHIVLRSHGGDDASWNLITLCSDCHDAVHGLHIVHRGLVLIVALSGDLDAVVNADEGIQLHWRDGWTPRHKQ